jgi:hypothetical protein
LFLYHCRCCYIVVSVVNRAKGKIIGVPKICNSSQHHYPTKMSVSSALLSRLQNPKLLNWLPAAAATGSAFNVVDPYQQHVIANIPDYENCNDAIAKAHAAFPMYSQTLASQRSKWLKKLADEQRKNVDDLAMILSLESAKPIREARFVVVVVVVCVRMVLLRWRLPKVFVLDS